MQNDTELYPEHWVSPEPQYIDFELTVLSDMYGREHYLDEVKLDPNEPQSLT